MEIGTHDLRLTGWADLLLVNDVVSLWIKMSLVTHNNYDIYRTHPLRARWHLKSDRGPVASHGLPSWY
jgi:hypothetical protein